MPVALLETCTMTADNDLASCTRSQSILLRVILYRAAGLRSSLWLRTIFAGEKVPQHEWASTGQVSAMASTSFSVTCDKLDTSKTSMNQKNA